jgi:recombination protein RecR
MFYSQPLTHLIEAFQRLPGIGPKSAQRIAFHMLKMPMAEVQQFTQAVVQAKEQIASCPVCFNLSSLSPCEICRNPNKQKNLLCVVCDPRDVFAIERTGEYQGLYHVLGGLISPLEGIGPEDLKIRELLARFMPSETNPVPPTEIILALPPTVEGDTTSLYLVKLIKPLDIPVSRIAFGLPVGGDLEYADSLTISRALQGRQAVS